VNRQQARQDVWQQVTSLRGEFACLGLIAWPWRSPATDRLDAGCP